MSDPVLGVDIGGTTVKWAATAADGRIARSGRFDTPTDGPDSVVAAIRSLRSAVAGEVDTTRVGITLPGHFDRVHGRTNLVPNLAGDWTDYPLREALVGGTGVHVELVNDARAFAFAELATTSEHDTTRAVFATIGTGLGGAIALDGTVLRDSHDGVGELGHLTTVIDGDPCGCGNAGCAEAYVGVRAIERRTGLPIADVRARLDAGDPEVTEHLRFSAAVFATAITNTAVLVRAPLIVIGGGIGTRWPEYATAARAALAARDNLIGPSRVLISRLGDHTGAIGAAIAATLAQPEGITS